MAKTTLDSILKRIEKGEIEPVYLVSGDLVAAEPQALRLAEAVAKRAGCSVESHKRPDRLSHLFADLRTLGLFSPAKVMLTVDTAILADSKAAAELIDQAGEGLPVGDPSVELGGAQREAASRLFQALHVFGMETDVGEASEVIASLPKWALQGGRIFRKKKPRGRNAKDLKVLQEGLGELLEAGRQSGLVGFAQGDLAELGELTQNAMPKGHCLILAESSVSADHPVVATLKERKAMISVATVSAGKGGDWQGLPDLIQELEQETGVGIAPDALKELARRTLRGTGDFRDKSAASASTARLGGEYRKLAGLAQGNGQPRIDRRMVEQTIKDRGEEDVWQILDAIGNGRAAEAVSRYHRLIESSNDEIAARLSFFSLLATFCRQLSAVAGVARVARVQPGVRNYNQFKSRWAPALQGDLPHGGKNPLAGLHPFRLHKAYLAASQIKREELSLLPWRALETELRIKGDSTQADAAVTALITHLVASRL